MDLPVAHLDSLPKILGFHQALPAILTKSFLDVVSGFRPCCFTCFSSMYRIAYMQLHEVAAPSKNVYQECYSCKKEIYHGLFAKRQLPLQSSHDTSWAWTVHATLLR